MGLAFAVYFGNSFESGYFSDFVNDFSIAGYASLFFDYFADIRSAYAWQVAVDSGYQSAPFFLLFFALIMRIRRAV